MIEIYLIRHGQASFGEPTYDCLSPLGERQATILGRHFHDHGIVFDAVYSGSLKRQVQTAIIVMQQMNHDDDHNITIDTDFNEFDRSDQLMNRLHTVIRKDPELAERMKRIHTHHKAISQIFDIAEKADMIMADETRREEEARQFRARIKRGIDNLVDAVGANRKVAVFTSGGPTAVALRQTLDTSREQTIRLSWELRNTSITILRHDQKRLGMVLFNCVAHLEAANEAGLITYI